MATKKTTPRPRVTKGLVAGHGEPPSTPPSPKALAEVTPLPADEQDPPLLTVLNRAVEQMTWLKDSDEPTVQLCREYCRRIDEAKRVAEEFGFIVDELRGLAEATESRVLMTRLAAVEKACDLTKVVAWVGPLLAGSLRDIGAAPAERRGLEDAGDQVNNRLAQIRAAADKRKSPRSR